MHRLSGRVVGSVRLATNSHLSPLYHMNQHISTMWTFPSSHQRYNLFLSGSLHQLNQITVLRTLFPLSKKERVIWASFSNLVHAPFMMSELMHVIRCTIGMPTCQVGFDIYLICLYVDGSLYITFLHFLMLIFRIWRKGERTPCSEVPRGWVRTRRGWVWRSYGISWPPAQSNSWRCTGYINTSG